MIKDPTDISPTFCIMPWAGIATNPQGGFRPCCWMSHGHSFKGSINDYKNSEYLKKIKSKFLQGLYPDECNTCRSKDLLGISSKRVIENKKWRSLGNNWASYQNTDYSFIDLRLSNTCNLGCVTCSSVFSSYIEKEIKNNMNKTPDYWKNDNYQINEASFGPYSTYDINFILKSTSKNAQIYCTGGEPSIDKRIMHLLEKLIDNGDNDKILLKFNSNFQVLNKKWISLLKKFKGKMYPSVDGIGKVAEYIRYPCIWKNVDRNIRYFIEECSENWTIEISPTVSILSIFSLKDIFEWTTNIQKNYNLGKKIHVHLGNHLSYPECYDIRNFPEDVKTHAEQHINFLKTNYSSLIVGRAIDDLIEYLYQKPTCDNYHIINELNKLDLMRKQSWAMSLKDLHGYMVPTKSDTNV